MKKASLVIFLLLMILYGCGGTKFYFFGVDADLFKEAKAKDWAKVGAGAVTSVAAHVGGHWIAGEIFDIDYEFNDFYTKEEVAYECWEGETCSNSDLRWFARSGFVLQHGIGLALTSFEKTRYSWYTRGYVATSAIQTWTYPIKTHDSNYSDFKMLDHANGNGDLEYGIYSTIALHNMLRVPWYKERK
jgi:hypothetical protein